MTRSRNAQDLRDVDRWCTFVGLPKVVLSDFPVSLGLETARSIRERRIGFIFLQARAKNLLVRRTYLSPNIVPLIGHFS